MSPGKTLRVIAVVNLSRGEVEGTRGELHLRAINSGSVCNSVTNGDVSINISSVDSPEETARAVHRLLYRGIRREALRPLG